MRAKNWFQSFSYKVLHISILWFFEPISAISYQLNKSEKVFPWFIAPSEWKSKKQNKANSEQFVDSSQVFALRKAFHSFDRHPQNCVPKIFIVDISSDKT